MKTTRKIGLLLAVMLIASSILGCGVSVASTESPKTAEVVKEEPKTPEITVEPEEKVEETVEEKVEEVQEEEPVEEPEPEEVPEETEEVELAKEDETEEVEAEDATAGKKGTVKVETVTNEPADLMAKAGFIKAKINKDYKFMTATHDNHAALTEATVKFENYVRVDNGDGYETVAIMCTYKVSDENANKYGMTYKIGAVDCYSYASGAVNVADEYTKPYSLTYNGVVYDKCSTAYQYITDGWSGKTYTEHYILTFKVPVGYKGIGVWTMCYGDVSFSVPPVDIGQPVYYFRCE